MKTHFCTLCHIKQNCLRHLWCQWSDTFQPISRQGGVGGGGGGRSWRQGPGPGAPPVVFTLHKFGVGTNPSRYRPSNAKGAPTSHLGGTRAPWKRNRPTSHSISLTSRSFPHGSERTSSNMPSWGVFPEAWERGGIRHTLCSRLRVGNNRIELTRSRTAAIHSTSCRQSDRANCTLQHFKI